MLERIIRVMGVVREDVYLNNCRTVRGVRRIRVRTPDKIAIEYRGQVEGHKYYMYGDKIDKGSYKEVTIQCIGCEKTCLFDLKCLSPNTESALLKRMMKKIEKIRECEE